MSSARSSKLAIFDFLNWIISIMIIGIQVGSLLFLFLSGILLFFL